MNVYIYIYCGWQTAKYHIFADENVGLMGETTKKGINVETI